MAEKACENGPEWQASGHSLNGDRSSRRCGLKGNISSAWVWHRPEGTSSGQPQPVLRSPHGHRWRGERYLLSQRGHDVLLFPDTYAWVMHGVIINHGEPQQTADTADATWEGGTQSVFRSICELGAEFSLTWHASPKFTATPPQGPKFSHFCFFILLQMSF